MARLKGSVRCAAVAVFAFAANPCVYAEAHTAERPPNVIIILTDDQGYNDFGCLGSKKIRTPNIDQMAAEGVRFTSFHAAAPICTTFLNLFVEGPATRVPDACRLWHTHPKK